MWTKKEQKMVAGHFEGRLETRHSVRWLFCCFTHEILCPTTVCTINLKRKKEKRSKYMLKRAHKVKKEWRQRENEVRKSLIKHMKTFYKVCLFFKC